MVRTWQLEDFRVCERLLAPFSNLRPIFRPPKQNTTNNHFKIEIITSKAAVVFYFSAQAKRDWANLPVSYVFIDALLSSLQGVELDRMHRIR